MANGCAIRVALTLTLALGWASSVSAQARMWVIRDADSTIYLMGTVHMLRPDVNWRSSKIDAALKDATELWLETPDAGLSSSDDQEIQRMLITAGLSPGAKIPDLLGPEDRALWAKATESVAALIPAQALERFRPWAASMFIEAAHSIQAGYDPNLGVEEVLARAAREQGDAVKGFETSEEQIRQLATLPEKVQLDLLHETLKAFTSDGGERLDRAVSAWAQGDDTLFEKELAEARASAPDSYAAEVVKRNDNWVGQIQTLLKGAGVSFIAVGAGHLVGPDSVQMKLKAKGIEVRDY